MDYIEMGLGSSDRLAQIYARYCYSVLKDPKMFALMPMDEERLTKQSDTKIEFLHYTQAPLIVYAAEQNTGKENSILNTFMKTVRRQPVSTNQSVTLADKVLKEAGVSKQFIDNYVKNPKLIPLWQLKMNLSTSELIEKLSEFDSTMYSWMQLEFADLNLVKAEQQDLDEIALLAEKEQVTFAAKDIMQEVKRFSPGLYNLLIKNALRIKVCELNPDSNTLQQDMASEAKQSIWIDYLSKNLR
jgi:hypothetical protein